MSGFTNDIMNAENVNFTGINPTIGQVTTDGQLLIGSTSAPNIRVNTLTAGTGIQITNGPGTIAIASTASLTDLHTARYIVASSTLGTGANYTTITSAIAAAVTTGINSTIFLQPGIYTENFSLPSGINIAAYQCDSMTPNVTISGTITKTTEGTSSISGIRLASNGASFLSVTGSVASIVNLNNCYLTTAFDPGITFSSTDSGAVININNCQGNISSSSTKFFAHSSAGNLSFIYSTISNTGVSTTASTCSAGSIAFYFSYITFPITTSGTSTFGSTKTSFNCRALSAISLTLGGSGNGSANHSDFQSGGTVSAISIGSSLSLFECVITSSESIGNAIAGAGAITYFGLSFPGSAKKISTSTQTGGTLQGGLSQTPSAGLLGENLSSAVTAVAITNATPTNVTSISITPGVWNISLNCSFSSSANTAAAAIIGISTTSATFAGNEGDQKISFIAGNFFTTIPLTLSDVRLVVTTTNTYYMVGQVNFTGGTGAANGRITATRVG